MKLLLDENLPRQLKNDILGHETYTAGTRQSVDQLGNEVEISAAPQRIISLVPSQTELLFDLGLKEKVVGITKFCIHPKGSVRDKIKIGGTKKFNFDRIASLNPDLIIANKEENYKEGIDRLRQKYPVWTSDISNLSEAFEMIRAVGEMTGTTLLASEIVLRIKGNFEKITPLEKKRKALYLIWKNPFMSVGKDTFIHEMLGRVGFENLVSDQYRYPELSSDRIKELNPELILLSSEPYPFKQKHVEEIKLQFPFAKVMLVDGEMFSWYGSRLQYAPDYFLDLLSEVNA